MALLSIERVTQYQRSGRFERTALRDVSLEIEPGELVSVWGTRRSGRSTLLRVASGVEQPHDGRVLFGGVDLAACRDSVLGRELAYCQRRFASVTECAVEHVMTGLLGDRVSQREAMRRAREMLAEVGAEDCAHLECHELDCGETVRVSIAAALVGGPKLIVIDEPTSGVDVIDRDPILRLLRVAANKGVAVLMTASDAQGLSGVDRALSIDNGELRGHVISGDARVVSLHRPAAAARAGSS
jgi:ABC-type lipoprotein export system ATPase subunit